MTTQPDQTGTRRRAAGAFDIRMIIAVLFAIYGAVLTVMGLATTSPVDLARAAGTNVNLWAGIGMLIVAGLFALWVWLRPILMPVEAGSPEQSPPKE